MNAVGTPSTPEAPPLRSIDVRDHDPVFCLERLTAMLRVRRLEERCAQLYGEGHIRGFLHLLIGEEAVTAGVMPQLCAEDNVVATYREHGHALLRGVGMNALMAEMYGKQEGCSRGRGGSMHLFDRATRFFGGQAIVAGGLPVAVGLALADRIRPRPGCMNVLAVHVAAQQAVERVRGSGLPFFLELHTYRFRAHSMFDAELYRDKAEVERWKHHDPIAAFIGQLQAAQRLDADTLATLEQRVHAEVDAAVAYAEAGHWEPEAELLRDVRAPAARSAVH